MDNLFYFSHKSLLLIAALSIAACGGGSKPETATESSPPTEVENVNFSGIWTGTMELETSGYVAAYAVVLDQSANDENPAEIYMVVDLPDSTRILSGTFTVAGENLYGTVDEFYSGDAAVDSRKISGNGVDESKMSINLNYSFAGIEGTEYYTELLDFDYALSQLESLAGNWHIADDTDEGNSNLLSIAEDGSFSFTGDCNYQGSQAEALGSNEHTVAAGSCSQYTEDVKRSIVFFADNRLLVLDSQGNDESAQLSVTQWHRNTD